MGLFTKIADFLGGGTIKAIAETVKDYFPPSMSDKEKAELSLRITEAENSKTLQTMAIVNEAQAEFNRRIVELEGSAADLKTIPVIGHILILLRGAQRPIWGVFTLYADYQTWSSVWTLTEKQEAMLLAVNVLVLGFLFGERCVRNIMPFIVQFFGKK